MVQNIRPCEQTLSSLMIYLSEYHPKTGENILSIKAYAATDIGLTRSTNQDSIWSDEDNQVFVVADGMGGHNGGDIASQMVVSIFDQETSKIKDSTNWLENTVRLCNLKIFQQAQEKPELQGMGTTICSLQLIRDEARICHIGDSRAYLIKQGEIFQITKDHTLVQEKLNLGLYDREQARLDKMKNVLVKTAGIESDMELDQYSYQLQDNDLILLCSDGLYGRVCDEDILSILEGCTFAHKDKEAWKIQQAVEKLIDLAKEHGGNDNISTILIHYRQD